MLAYRITYSNYDLKNSNIERLKKDMKNLFWLKGEAPKDWRRFDDEIDFNSQQSRGGDCIEIVFNESMGDVWINSILKSLKKKNNVRIIEKVIGYNQYEEI